MKNKKHFEIDYKFKKYFKGSYYKFQSRNGILFAIIHYLSNHQEGYQIITKDGSFQIEDINQVVINENYVELKINQNNLKLHGKIEFIHPVFPNKDVMGPLRVLPLQCKHNLYIPLMKLKGVITLFDSAINYEDGFGYIEGDEGRSFPKDYLWFNAVNENSSITLAIADIPFGLFSFRGMFAYILLPNKKELVFATYNFAKIKMITDKTIIIKKGSYTLSVDINNANGHPLLAPQLGNMKRIIHKCISTPIKIKLYKKGNVIFECDYPYSALERVNI